MGTSFGLTAVKMKGDGNCQFRALAFNLFRSQAYHATVRKAAIEHMRQHSDFFGTLFETGAEFEKYLASMAKDRTWGDELTLRAVVEAYRCVAHLVTSEAANWYLVYQPDPKSDKNATKPECPKGTLIP